MTLGIVGMYAATTRPGATVVDAVPTLTGVAAGVLALTLLTRRADEIDDAAHTGAGVPADISLYWQVPLRPSQ